jgi:exopolysaccharide biosynthesis WecB/TagA/CpsF family protein
MSAIPAFSPAPAPRQGARKPSRETVFLVGDLLPLLDFAGVLLAAYLGTLMFAKWMAPAAATAVLTDVGRAALAAAVLAPFILCDRAFVSFASAGQTAALIRCYAVRFVMFAGAVTAIGFASRSLARLPGAWLALWLGGTLGVTALTRLLLVTTLRRLERRGVLAETVAVIGAGPLADRLIGQLRQLRGDGIEIVGVFDDRTTRVDTCTHRPAGSIADLIELGKARPMDWILLALPASDRRLQPLVHRLKALAVPVGLWQPDTAATADTEAMLPRWILTLLGLPLAALKRLFRRASPPKLALALDDYDLAGFAKVAARFGHERYGYMVNPNADHLIRLHREPSFRRLYADASFVLLDSRFVSHLLGFTRRLALPVCTGSDLTEKLLGEVVVPDDRLVLIGGSVAQATRLRERYGLKRLAHFNPPMGFILDSHAVEACLRFVEAHSPFRYCLLAVGAPQQETIAQQLKARGVARGLALCIGASIDFLTGAERRAPAWMQRCGLEWLFRLLQAPGRMAGRYLVRGPQLFGLLPRTEIALRTALEPLAAP